MNVRITIARSFVLAGVRGMSLHEDKSEIQGYDKRFCYAVKRTIPFLCGKSMRYIQRKGTRKSVVRYICEYILSTTCGL
jgi:hypothetical protein